MPAKKNSDTFEKSLQDLETIIQKMEGGTLTLEASLKAFEKGVKLAHSCQKTLANVEQKVNILTDTHLSPLDSKSDESTTHSFTTDAD